MLLPVLGFDVLRPAGHEAGMAPAAANGQAAVATTGAEFTSREGGSEARAREAGDEFVVLAGSLARLKENASASDFVRRRRQELREAGTLVPAEDGRSLRFTRDVAFDSPSGAGSVVFGGNVNGREFWRHATTGQRYGDWRAGLIGGGAG